MWHDRLKTGLIVVLLTGLVWFFADQANMDSKTASVLLTVQPPNGSYLVMSQVPNPLQFKVTFRAPRGVISEIEDELRTTLVLDKPESGAKYARLTFESVKELSQLEAIRKRGLTIISASPEAFSVELDSMVRRPMQVKPEFGELVVECEEPKPASVDVILPSKMAEELPGDTLAVDATRYVDAGKPNQLQLGTVELRWPQAGPLAKLVHFEPPSVGIRFRLRDTTAQKTFQSVEVWFNASYDVLSRYVAVPVDRAEFRPDITVAGPKQLIENLRKEDIDLFVQVYASDEANIGQTITRQVKIRGLPLNVQVITQPRDVRFTLQEKPAAGTSP